MSAAVDTTSDRVRAHYEPADAETNIVTAVTRAVDAMEGPVTATRLGAFDQFHVRGPAATAELGALLDAPREAEVLDAGSGLGGPARMLAEAHGWRVTGVDLTPSFVAVARMLTERTGLAGRVRFEVGDLLALPFADAAFDATYTQHVVMNVADRLGAWREIRRVLRAGGRFAFHDVLAAEEGAEPHYPVPWARGPEHSTLLTEARTRAVLAEAGFRVDRWEDVTAEAVAWFAAPRPATPGPTLASIVGPRFGPMTANFGRSLAEGRIRLVMGRCVAEGAG